MSAMSGSNSFGLWCLLLSAALLAQSNASVLVDPENRTTPLPSSAVPTEARVQLGVYIESLCPDSKRFFLKQLAPTNRAIGQLFDVEIVPFGHARVLGNNKMVCQHGLSECAGNRRMACLLTKTANQTEAIETLGCMFESPDAWRDCVKKHMPNQEKSIEELNECSAGEQSYKLMVEAEKDTGRVDYIPHLTLDGKWDDEIQFEVEHSLKKAICARTKVEPKPEACKETST